MIKAGKFNVAPGHLFSRSKGNAIPGSRGRTPAALRRERGLAPGPPVMVAARASPTRAAVREGPRGSGAAGARKGHGSSRPEYSSAGESYLSGSNYWGCRGAGWGGDRKCNICNSGFRLARLTNLLNLQERVVSLDEI